ncbi:hypothetical protein F5B22DRAFT_518933 [Xylaria bambusicola]|uniref:uncharacterized protein n=1 Tax=Xylaria bambusicola TaxID=326684 RepID=UPI002007F908|nr:uncharacterized protein F5B22DRAFT_518933 [Xylaria bambusicola]KAI0505542.1 hypothetical protein F5B22DRAFT_518933 [Xylaria bambusicola]
MYAFSIFVSLAAAVSASKPLHYTVPSNFKAAVASNCTLPAEFLVTNFTTYADKTNETLSAVSFYFSDPDTKIETICQRNSSSTPSGPSKNIYGCGNANVAFIYQTTGVAGLTLTERACPGGSGLQFEASGLITPDLDCTDTSTGTTCHSQKTSIQGDFDSFQPIPPGALLRRRRLTRSG